MDRILNHKLKKLGIIIVTGILLVHVSVDMTCAVSMEVTDGMEALSLDDCCHQTGEEAKRTNHTEGMIGQTEQTITQTNQTKQTNQMKQVNQINEITHSENMTENICAGANAELIGQIEFQYRDKNEKAASALEIKTEEQIRQQSSKLEENVTETMAQAPVVKQEQTAEQPVEQPVQKTYDSLELLAICIQAEAGGESFLGKQMVCDVILNRVDDPDWPDTVEGVITEKYQFSSYWDGGMAKVQTPSEETYAAIQQELQQRSYPGIYYFTAYEYSAYGTPWKQVGNHCFSTK